MDEFLILDETQHLLKVLNLWYQKLAQNANNFLMNMSINGFDQIIGYE